MTILILVQMSNINIKHNGNIITQKTEVKKKKKIHTPH